MEIRQQLQQVRLERLVSTIDLIDEQYDGMLPGNRVKKRSLQQVSLGEYAFFLRLDLGGAASVTAFAELPPGEGAPARLKILEMSLQSAIGRRWDVPRVLRMTLLCSGLAAAAALMLAAYAGSVLDADLESLAGVYAKRVWSPDYPWAPTPEQREREYAALEREWAGEMDVSVLAPSATGDPGGQTATPPGKPS